MKFRGKAITGTSLLMVLGVVCFASIIVSATALVFLSMSDSNGPTVVGFPLTATAQGSTDDSQSEYGAWGTSAIPGNTYTDGVKIAGTYTGDYSIEITITSTVTISNADISMTYLKGDSGSYNAVGVFSGSGTTTMTAVIHGEVASGVVNTNYNFLVNLEASAPAGTYTISYVAIVTPVV